MRKIYSLVLMATMLLMGTNAWAQVAKIGEQTYATLEAAFNAATNGDVIVLLANIENVSNTINLGQNGTDAKNVTLDFAGYYAKKTANNNFINLYKGSLRLKDSNPNENSGLKHIWNPSAPQKKYTITVYGTYERGINGRTANAADLFTHLYVEKEVKIVSDGIAIMLLPHRALACTNNKSCMIYKDYWNGLKWADSDPRGVANGVRIDIYGNVYGALYAAQANGQLACPLEQYEAYYNTIKDEIYGGAAMSIADTAYAPYVRVHEGAHMTSASASKSAAIYSSGYARWMIEGECTGATGVYMKSGDITLNGATVTSNYTGTAENELGQTIGVSGGGNAVVVESNGHYAGNCVLDVENGTTITTTADNGTALLEAIAPNADGSKVEEITINGGTFSGEQAIVVSEQTAEGNKVEIFDDASFTGSVTVDGDDTPEAIANLMGEGVHATIDPVTGAVTVSEGYSVTLNGYGMSTFSATKKVALPSGVKAYAVTALNGETLQLAEINGNVLPAGTGVVLYKENEAGEQFILNESTDNAATVGSNLMKPATDWSASYAAGNNAYILHDNELWIYTGENFKKNKAFFVIPAANNAPKRLRMVFNQTETPTAVENVETQNVKAVKFVGEDGQLYIRRGEAVYTVQGQVVK